MSYPSVDQLQKETLGDDRSEINSGALPRILTKISAQPFLAKQTSHRVGELNGVVFIYYESTFMFLQIPGDETIGWDMRKDRAPAGKIVTQLTRRGGFDDFCY